MIDLYTSKGSYDGSDFHKRM